MVTNTKIYGTVDDIRQEAIKLLREQPGTGVQVYSEDTMLLHVRHAFDRVFADAWWPDYSQWVNGATLDGATGVVTAALPYLRWDDIRKIFHYGTSRELSEPPPALNVYMITGTTARYVEATNTEGRLFRVWPLTAAGQLTLHGRVHPGYSESEFLPTLQIKMDRDLMSIATALETVIDMGDNPGMIDKFQKQYDTRMGQLWPNRAQWTTLGGGDGMYPVDWWASP